MFSLSTFDHVLVLVAGGLALTLLTRRFSTAQNLFDHLSAGWRAPILVGVLAACTILWVWWPSRSVPVVHDEAAYLLQAELLARGQFAGPAPSVPELSEQAAVIVSPVLAPKPSPGQALALLPGVILGLPWLSPVLLTGLTAAVLFTLVRLVGGAGAGLLAVVLWVSAPGVLRWQPSYFSEVTSTALLLLGWLVTWRWWKSGHIVWLIACAMIFALLAITRPLTAVAHAVPIAVLVLFRMWSAKRTRQMVPAMLIGALPLLMIPLQSREVTGQWSRTPWSLYSSQYMPWDRPGLGLDERPPTRTLPADLALSMAEFVNLHRAHTAAAIPSILVSRVQAFWRQQTTGWRLYLLPLLALVGMVAFWRIGFLILGVVTLHFGLYLSYAHQPYWTLYYAELVPLVAALAALGLSRIELLVQGHRERPGIMAIGISILLAALTIPILSRQRQQHLALAQPWLALDSAIAATGNEYRFIYIRYSAHHDPHQSLIRNRPDGGKGRLQIVYEPTPSQDHMLQARFPDHQAWLYEAATETMRRLR